MRKQTGDEHAEKSTRFEQLYQRYASALLSYTRRRTDQSTAEDVASEVFGIAWRRLDDVPKAAELPWLYSPARNVLANERRASNRRAELVEQVAATARTTPPDDDVSSRGVDDVL